ncbi:MAG: cyclic nucleotide-binding domain-containing protein [Deltaproteobacteria bacterium]|nr:cyclic nucleotide-binding domain-containing protein [Deltaproteobacteria bacterium]MBW2066363.1 cyclic nucleotide-binding domain-containing protein [Deltaproteobacteria bacterium]
MYFDQMDLLRGMNRDFVKAFIDLTVRDSHRKGDFLFREGDEAQYFYILLKGSVKISIGQTGHTVYRVDRPGELFGWSSLVGRDLYSASAECMEDSKLLKVENVGLERIMEEHSADGMVFYKRLAKTLGNRLLASYQMISGPWKTGVSESFGTGQVQESEATRG